MPKIHEIIQDLNVTIADMETLRAMTDNSNSRTNIARAIGQLKAARGCLLCVIREVA